MNKNVGRNFLDRFLSIDKRVIVTISLLFILFLSIVLVTSRTSLNRMAQRRAVQDMETIAEDQVYFLNKTIEKNFQSLDFLAMYITENHISFDSLVETSFLNELTYISEWASVGFADPDGYITEGFGRKVGNIYHRKYFKDIMLDGKKKSIEFIHNTIVGDAAKTALSVPIMDGDKVKGVLYCLKDTAAIESFLLGNAVNNSLDFFICDSNLDIFAGNEDFQSAVEDDLENDLVYSLKGKAIDKNEFLSILTSGKNGVVKCTNKVPEFLCYTPIGIRDVYLFTKVGVEAGTSKYTGDFRKSHLVFDLICVLFILINGFLFIFSIVHIIRKRKLDEYLRFERTRNAIMLDNLNCDIFDYNIAEDEFWTKNRVMSSSEAFEIKKDFYPDFDSSLLLKNFDKVRTTGEKLVFEIGEDELSINRYFQIILTPYRSAEGKITHIFGVVFDKTKEHTVISQSMEMQSHIKSYTQAIVSSSVGYMNINLTKDIVEDAFKVDGKGKSSAIEIPGLPKPYKASDFSSWWNSNMLLGDQKEAKKSCSPESLIAKFNAGIYYSEIYVKSMFMDKNERTIRYAFFLNRNTSSGDIMALVIAYDATESVDKDKRLSDLAEELKESKVKNSIAQMQPHFLYNALGSIREIILDDPQYASDLVYDFTTHLRACIRSMQNNEPIPFEQEITNINAYVNIERMRLGDKLKVLFDTPFTDFKVVPLGIQPLVENSIRHGIYKRGKAGGTVIVRSFKENDDIVIQVKDDGVGFDYEQIKQEVASGKRDSTGMQNLVFRFEKMMGAKVEVASEVGVGSTITIRFRESV